MICNYDNFRHGEDVIALPIGNLNLRLLGPCSVDIRQIIQI